MAGNNKSNSVRSQGKRKRAEDILLPTKSKKLKKVSTPLPSCKIHHFSSDKIDIGVQSDSSILYSEEADQNIRTAHNLSLDLTHTSTASQTSTPTNEPNDSENLEISLDVSQRASDLVDRLMSLIDEEEETVETQTIVPVSAPSEPNAMLQKSNGVQCIKQTITAPIEHSVSADTSHSSVSSFYGLNKKSKSAIQNVSLLKNRNSSNLKNKNFHEVDSEIQFGRTNRQIMHCNEVKSPEILKLVSFDNNQGSSQNPVPNDFVITCETQTTNRRLSSESLLPDLRGKSPLSVVYALPLKEVKVAACIDFSSEKKNHFNGIKSTPKKRASNVKSDPTDMDRGTAHVNSDAFKLNQNRKSHRTYASSEPLLHGTSNDRPQKRKYNKKKNSTKHVGKPNTLENTRNPHETPDQSSTQGTSKNQVSSPSCQMRKSPSAFSTDSVFQPVNEMVIKNSVHISSETPLSSSEKMLQNSRKCPDVVTHLSSSTVTNKDISATRNKKQYKEIFTALLQPSSYPSLGSGPIAPPRTKKKYVGAHVSAAGGIHNVFENAKTIKASSFAMFMRNQRQWVAKPFDEKHLDLYIQKAKGFPMHLILPHGSYLMNVGSSNPELLQKSRDLLKEELLRCNQLSIPHFNFHPGSCVGGTGRDECCRTIAESINIAHREVPRVIVVLENMCRQGNTIGGDFQELRRIIELVEDRSRVGVCLDTCHAHNAGYDLSTEGGFDTMVRDFDTIIGFQFLRGVHINDSKNPAGAHVDRHECIGKGHIGLEGMRRVMNCPHFDDLPIILETPYTDDAGYAKEIRVLEGLIRTRGAADREKEEAARDGDGKVLLEGGGEQEVESVEKGEKEADMEGGEKIASSGKGKTAVNIKRKPTVIGRGKVAVNGKGKPAVIARRKAAVNGKQKPVVIDEEKPAVIVEEKPAVIVEEKPAVIVQEKPAVIDEEKPAVIDEEKPAVIDEEKPAVTEQSVAGNKVVANSKPAGRGRPRKQSVPLADLENVKVCSKVPAMSVAKQLVKTAPKKLEAEAKATMKKPIKSRLEDVRKEQGKSIVEKATKLGNSETKQSQKNGPSKRKLVAKETDVAPAKKKKM